MKRALTGVFALVVVACGGAPAPAPQAPSAAAPEAPAAAPAVWKDDMPKEQKMAFMKAKVAPNMGKVFQAQDSAHYANFGCTTCHGPKFQDPKDFLPKLTLKDGKITAFAEKPAVAKFMAEKVVPEMASTLGKPPFDPATGKGFGCMGCHTVDKK
jgi:cytochrome c551/c552